MARVLVVEDDPLISMLIEEWLCELGHTLAGAANSVSDGLRIIDESPPDAAIVDVSLKRESSLPIAEALRARGVPFLLATGRATAEFDAGAFAGAPLLSKPFVFGDFREALAALVAPA